MAATSMEQLQLQVLQEISCNECHVTVFKTGDIYKDRADHYKQLVGMVHSCPICLLILSTTCALEAHLRIHLKIPPYICTDCGITLPDSIISYPFNHNCEGFNKMRINIKFKCNVGCCNSLIYPYEYEIHFRTHINKIFECTYCLKIWTNEGQSKCPKCMRDDGNILYFQCPLCRQNLFTENNIELHIKAHCNNISNELYVQVYPCKICLIIYQDAQSLLNHHIFKHKAENIEHISSKLLITQTSEKTDNIVYLQVIKTCNQCFRNYAYQCRYELINTVQTPCPYGCSRSDDSFVADQEHTDLKLKCFLCKMKINERWVNIKKHYASFHKNHKCLDLKVVLKRIDMKLYFIKRGSKNNCNVTEITETEEKENDMQINYIDHEDIEMNTPIVIEDSEIDEYEMEKSVTDESMTEKSMDRPVLEQYIIEDETVIEGPIIGELVIEEPGIEDPFKEKTVMEESVITEPFLEAGILEESVIEENMQSVNDSCICSICNWTCGSIASLETHMITTHRDPSMPYQCLECGKCFVNKPSFSTHLSLKHYIKNVKEYINTKPCYNEIDSANNRYREINEHIKVNQCSVCQKQFENSYDLDQHFRGHGLAYLMRLKERKSFK